MKKILTLIPIFCFFYLLADAQVIFSEDFESGTVPTGWQNQTLATDGGWRVGVASALSSQGFGIATNGSTNIAVTNDDACNCDKSSDLFITPPIDLSGTNTYVLKSDIFYGNSEYQGVRENGNIEISEDLVNWELLEDVHGHGFWDQHIIDLSAYQNKTVYIGFRYEDQGGWLYGFGIDNVSVEVPPNLDLQMYYVKPSVFGQVNKPFPISGAITNQGATEINTMEIAYFVNGVQEDMEIFTDLEVVPFSTVTFDFTNDWIPSAEGIFDIEVRIISVNDGQDDILTNNSFSISTEIFGDVVVPNKMAEFLSAPTDVTEIASGTNILNKPTDLDFFPVLGKNELWVINERTESEGGSTLTIADATTDDRSFEHKVDGNSWHFMSLPTGIAFSDDNFNFANSPGVLDANHSGGTFTGPALWSSDPSIYAQPSGGNGSHLDMLHGSPYSMGIAHEVDNTFWIYDNYHKDIVRYDFVSDHGPGNDDHSDAIVRRYSDIGINATGGIPSHMILNKETGWLYFVDNGNRRVMKLDINSATGSQTLGEINEPLAEHSLMTGFTHETIIEYDSNFPCGIEIFENYLLVGIYNTGNILVYDIENNYEELGSISAGNPGITGIKVGPDGNVWVTNRETNSLLSLSPGEVSNTYDLPLLEMSITPNPANKSVIIEIPEQDCNSILTLKMFNSLGQEMYNNTNYNNCSKLDVSEFIPGSYFIEIVGKGFYSKKQILIQR